MAVYSVLTPVRGRGRKSQVTSLARGTTDPSPFVEIPMNVTRPASRFK